MFNSSKEQTITFTKVIDVSDNFKPKPALKLIPDWYKEIENRIPNKKSPDTYATIKKCVPVFDALTSGYLIVTPCDVYVSIKDEEPHYESALPEIISFHPRKQGYKHPAANEHEFAKWANPWAINTPKGYSTLFIPPMHNPNPWFEILPGLVDTDSYSAPVNFPFVLKKTNEEFLIPAGTPLAQVIPFKRDSWNSIINNDDSLARKHHNLLISYFFDRYKKLYWHRKEYK